MIKTLNPYNNSPATTSKTAEILSRYRPIAPKPEIPATDGPNSPSSSSSPPSSMSQKIQQSPFLRNLWPQLQARPTRTRKRGRTAVSPPSLKRQRLQSATFGVHPISPQPATAGLGVTHQAFASLGMTRQLLPTTGMETLPAASPRSLVTLPLLPCSAAVPVASEVSDQVIDLNLSGGGGPVIADIPEEKDLLRQLQGPVNNTATIISPRPLRPVGSSISVGSISTCPRLATETHVPRKPEEVEEEVEADELPSLISDSNNKVRVVNSAYKEMVGQPECSWLDSMTNRGGRISGEVTLRFPSGEEVPISSDGFSCWVKIEWKKSSVRAFCEVSKLSCQSKDYLFWWRFHTQTRSSHASPAELPIS